DLYARVVDACRAKLGRLPAPNVRAPTRPTVRNPATPTPAARTEQPAAPKPTVRTEQPSSRAPTPQQPAMSAQCQQLVSNYVTAARANDGPGALAAYSALKRAGGCGV